MNQAERRLHDLLTERLAGRVVPHLAVGEVTTPSPPPLRDTTPVTSRPDRHLGWIPRPTSTSRPSTWRASAGSDHRPPSPYVLVISAGTSDIPVAEEAAVTAQALGSYVERLYDVGVAGLHRVMGVRERLDAADCLIVVAGMEGALPSVVGGLVGVPLVAVPTSVGYGASFGGLAALLGMLNSCAPGVTVVNIDNGFGAGVFAARVARRSAPRESKETE